MTQLLDRPDSSRIRPVNRRRAQTPGPQPRKFRPDIEGMRAFAVVSVVLYHADLGIRGGYIGVDVFFVISGFLITKQLVTVVGRDGIRALPTFYTRRIKRLLPAAAVVVIATILAVRIWAPATQVRPVTIDGIFTTFYGLNYRLAIEGTQYLHQGDAVSPLQHFWSLGVEEQFYVAWPILIVLTAWIGRRYRNVLLFTVILAASAVTYWLSIKITQTSAPWAYFSVQTRAWELGLGAMVAISAGQLARMPRKIAEIGAVVGLAAVIASDFLFSNATKYPGSVAMIPVAGAALLIACGCGPRCRVERYLAEPMLQCIGRISYSWYLWHWPMLIVAPMIVGHPLSWFGRIVVVWLSFCAAIASYFLIENPVRHIGKRNWQGFLTGFAITASIIACGVLVLNNLPSTVGSGKAVAATAAAPLTGLPKELNAALSTTDVPRNLTPNPASAASDTPPSSKNGCHADFHVIKQGPCVFGDPNGTHTAVLFGDSHMEQWLPAFIAAADKSHWKIVNWTKASCPPAQISIYESTTIKGQYTQCDQWRSITMQRIEQLKPDLVFVSQSENFVPHTVSTQQYTSTLVQTLTMLENKLHVPVQFFDDIPVPNSDLPGCVADHLSSVNKCDFSLKKAYTYPDRHAAVAPAVTKAGFHVIEPSSWICAPAGCPAVVGPYLVFRNTTHLTATYSKWLEPEIAPLLKIKAAR